MGDKKYRYTMECEGRTQELFSIVTKTSGDVFIIVAGMDKVRKLGVPTKVVADEMHEEEIRQCRFTIHPSVHDEIYNRINLHHDLYNDHKLGLSGRTHAIKIPVGFTFLFSRYGSSYWNAKKLNGTVKVLDGYDGALTPCWMILLSHEDCHLSGDYLNLNYFSVVLNGVRITVLWSFIAIPILPLGAVTMAHGQDPDGGFHEFEVLPKDYVGFYHEQMTRRHFGELVQTVMKGMAFDTISDRQVFMSSLGKFAHFKSGRTDSLAYQLHKDSCRLGLRPGTVIRVLDVF